MVAVIVTGKLPDAVGAPESTPPDERPTVPGSPDPAENVIGPFPVAVTLNVLAAFSAKVVDAALVNVGATVRFRVKLAVIGPSVGVFEEVAKPQFPSGSTAMIEAGAKLITYELLTAVD